MTQLIWPVLASWLALAACTGSQRPAAPATAGAASTGTGGGTASDTAALTPSPAQALPAGIYVEVDQRRAAQQRDPRRIWVLLDDGSGERSISGELLTLVPHYLVQMPNSGVYPTRTSGTLHLTVQLFAPPHAPGVPDTQATLDLPLRPDWLWTAHVLIGRVDPRMPMSGEYERRMVIPTGPGQIAGDSLYVFVDGRSVWDRRLH